MCLCEDLYTGNPWKKVDICPAAHNLPDSSQSQSHQRLQNQGEGELKWENIFSEESFLWHPAQGYDGVLAFACCSNVSVPVAHFSFCFVPQSTKYLLQAADTILKQDCFSLPRPSSFQGDQSSHHAGPEDTTNQSCG